MVYKMVSSKSVAYGMQCKQFDDVKTSKQVASFICCNSENYDDMKNCSHWNYGKSFKIPFGQSIWNKGAMTNDISNDSL